ncbi:MAG: cation transporter [Salibacteraceae bacterium]
MKIKFLIAIIALQGLALPILAQKVQKDTLLVKGVCGMCKNRIEDAAYGKGVKFAQWDQNTKMLEIIYRSDKTSITEIEDRILEAGHSTSNRQSPAEKYNNLPECCRYEHVHDH